MSLSVVLIGIGGYGSMYCGAFRDPRLAGCRLVAAVDPNAMASPERPFLREMGVPTFADVEDLPSGLAADLAIVASPMHCHAEHTIRMLQRGSHVLCEKPLCAVLAQASQMIRARDLALRCVGIGYQWSFSAAIQRLKRDILAGDLGAPRRLKTLVLWPRNQAYYRRNSWAGRRTDPGGRLVLDSPVNNAAAHFLHNMLYVLGDRADRSAVPLTVQAELYRGHDIDNYDTAALRCRVSGGAELLFVTSHATTENDGPRFRFEFDQAVVEFAIGPSATMAAVFRDGTVRNYGSPEESHYQKLFAMLDCARSGASPPCGIEAAVPHLQVMLAAQVSSEVQAFPGRLVSHSGEQGTRKVHVQGLDEVLLRCFAEDRLPSELGVDWASPARVTAVPAWQPYAMELQHLNATVRPPKAAAALAVRPVSRS